MCVPRNGPAAYPKFSVVQLPEERAHSSAIVVTTILLRTLKTAVVTIIMRTSSIFSSSILLDLKARYPVMGSEIFRAAHASSVAQRLHLRRKIQSLSVDFGELRLELKGKKKLGQCMFLMFYGACLFMGVFNICATGWFGSTVDRLSNNRDRVSHGYGYREGSDGLSIGSEVEQTLTMVASGIVDTRISMTDHSGIWSKPDSENFTQCIDHPKSHKKLDLKTNGFLLTNANGGLNQMRFGVCLSSMDL